MSLAGVMNHRCLDFHDHTAREHVIGEAWCKGAAAPNDREWLQIKKVFWDRAVKVKMESDIGELLKPKLKVYPFPYFFRKITLPRQVLRIRAFAGFHIQYGTLNKG